jgi:citrate/tricarballylate utilization protein
LVVSLVATLLGMRIADLAAEAAREFTICNACRYCEGYCAVFPAMERRTMFLARDIDYLANLCHNCGECYHACQYAPPHEFQLDLPATLARRRVENFHSYAWPAAMARYFGHAGTAAVILSSTGFSLMLGIAWWLSGANQPTTPGDFYAVLPHGVLVALFGAVGLFVLLAIGISTRAFWRQLAATAPAPRLSAGHWRQAFSDAARLTYLHAAGADCPTPSGQASPWRRRFHHCTLYGFLLCFAATSVATLYHYVFGWQAPYAMTSLPVLLGVAGGAGLLLGPLGLWWQKRHANTQPASDDGLLVALFLTSLTGLALLAWRDSAAMPVLLIVHLGVVLCLFLSMPYGRFKHAVFRTAALLRYAQERDTPIQRFGAD